jgi:hypothetical protein
MFLVLGRTMILLKIQQARYWHVKSIEIKYYTSWRLYTQIRIQRL